MRGDVLGHLVVLDRGEVGAERRLLIVEIGLRRRRQHVHVDAGGIHVLAGGARCRSRRSGTAGRRRPPTSSVGDLRVVGRDGHLDARLAQQRGGFLGQDVGVGVDRSHVAISSPENCNCVATRLPELPQPGADASPCRAALLWAINAPPFRLTAGIHP